MTRRIKRGGESGFAMLLVFAMAAAVAWMLYMELPRLAFEAQRTKEELLIERGEQYVRGIEVFQRKNKKLPQNMEELERTNGIRFLRRRYVDPLTGKDEWRLIHAMNGQLTDSLIKKAGTDANSSTAAANPYAVGATAVDMQGANAPAPGGPRRASEVPGAAGLPGAAGMPGAPEAGAPGAPGEPPPPGTEANAEKPEDPNAPPAPGVIPGGTDEGNPPGGVPTERPGPFGTPNRVATGNPQNNPQNNAQNNSQTAGRVVRPPNQIGSGYTFGSGYSNQPQPQPVPVTQAGAGPGAPEIQQGGFGSPLQGGVPLGGANGSPPGVNPATDIIRRLLTTPNPQGLAAAMGQNQAGGGGTGIVGVASKVDREGIKIYNERTNYKEWEFVYDPTKQNGGAQGAPAGGPQNNQGTGPFQSPSPFQPPPAQGGRTR